MGKVRKKTTKRQIPQRRKRRRISWSKIQAAAVRLGAETHPGYDEYCYHENVSDCGAIEQYHLPSITYAIGKRAKKDRPYLPYWPFDDWEMYQGETVTIRRKKYDIVQVFESWGPGKEVTLVPHGLIDFTK